jgi:hypothetical protein
MMGACRDEVRYAALGIQTRLARFAEWSSLKADRQLTTMIRETLAALGCGPDWLRYDPAAWTNTAPGDGQ